jgi:hypothetical protein
VLGILNLGICVIFPACGLFANIDIPAGDSEIMNRIASACPREARKPKNVFLTSKPSPESKWNPFGLWQKTRSSPDTYVPKGYGSTPPDNTSRGTWFTDSRDGKRLFAPNTYHNGYSSHIWMTEAAKITATR